MILVSSPINSHRSATSEGFFWQNRGSQTATPRLPLSFARLATFRGHFAYASWGKFVGDRRLISDGGIARPQQNRVQKTASFSLECSSKSVGTQQISLTLLTNDISMP